MMRKLKKKIRSSRGFTLAETLMAVLILLIASAIVVEGIPMAKRVHDRTVDTANAQVMLSTAMTMLRDELSAASDVACANDGSELEYIKYVSGSTGCTVVLYPCTKSDGNGSTVYMREYLSAVTDDVAVTGLDGNGGDSCIDQELILTNDDGLRLQLGSIDAPTDTSPLFTIHNIRVYRRGQTEPLAGVEEYVIRTVRH